MVIINHGLQTMTNEVIIPHSGWEHEPNEDSKPRDAEWTTVFKNTSGCLRSPIHPAHVASADTGLILEQVIKVSHFWKHQMPKFLRLNRGRQLADWFRSRPGWMTRLQKCSWMSRQSCWDPTCVWRQVLRSWGQTSENLWPGRCLVSAHHTGSDERQKDTILSFHSFFKKVHVCRAFTVLVGKYPSDAFILWETFGLFLFITK